MLNDKWQKPLRTRPLIAIFFIAVCGFILSLTGTTDWLYSKTKDHRVLTPAHIIAGKSQAPNQYRILSPLLYHSLDKALIHNPEKSDHIVIFLSILAAYLAAGALFYRSSDSIPATLLALLALLGCFSFGMMWKYRQEFFEVALVSVAFLAVLSIRRNWVMYSLLAVATLLGSLNRETYIFCIMAVAVHIAWHRVILNKERPWEHIGGLLVLFAIFTACYVGPRWYYDLSDYHCSFWTYKGNILNLSNLTSPYNLAHMGAGLLFAYAATLVLGNRKYLPFILGYAIPMLFVASFISAFREHRVFYPLMVLIVASILDFSFKDGEKELADKKGSAILYRILKKGGNQGST